MERAQLNIPKKTKLRETERGELLVFFQERLNIARHGTAFPKYTFPRIAKLLEGLELKDLYYIQSYFKDLERNKGLTTASKWFHWSLKNPTP